MWLLSRAPKHLREAELSPHIGLRGKGNGKSGTGEEVIPLEIIQRILDSFKVLGNLLNFAAGKLYLA